MARFLCFFFYIAQAFTGHLLCAKQALCFRAVATESGWDSSGVVTETHHTLVEARHEMPGLLTQECPGTAGLGPASIHPGGRGTRAPSTREALWLYTHRSSQAGKGIRLRGLTLSSLAIPLFLFHSSFRRVVSLCCLHF